MNELRLRHGAAALPVKRPEQSSNHVVVDVQRKVLVQRHSKFCHGQFSVSVRVELSERYDKCSSHVSLALCAYFVAHLQDDIKR